MKCLYDDVLDMAIAQGNMDLANKIVNLYKADVNVKYNSKDHEDIDFHDPTFVYKSKEAAQAKYDEAFGKDENKKEVVEEEVQSTPNKSKKNRKK